MYDSKPKTDFNLCKVFLVFISVANTAYIQATADVCVYDNFGCCSGHLNSNTETKMNICSKWKSYQMAVLRWAPSVQKLNSFTTNQIDIGLRAWLFIYTFTHSSEQFLFTKTRNVQYKVRTQVQPDYCQVNEKQRTMKWKKWKWIINKLVE